MFSEFGCKADTSVRVYVTSPPVAEFDLSNDEGCAPLLIDVTNNSSGDNIEQFWCIAGDTIYNDTLEDIFLDGVTKDSLFEIVLKVQNECGLRTEKASVLVHPYPLVNFGISQDEGCSPSLVAFSNTTLGDPETFLWLTNDTSFTSPELPDQFYTTTDTMISVYPVVLIASNACGTDTLQKEITVFPPDVEAFIEQDTFRGCAPFAFSLESFLDARSQDELADSRRRGSDQRRRAR